MFPFTQAITPAVRTHLDAQVAFFNELSQSLTRSFQSLCEAHIQLSQALLEDSAIASQQFLNAATPTEALSVATARAQPTSLKLQAYQQQLARVAADAQVELSRVSAEHVQNTSRTAQALAQEVARVAGDQTQTQLRQQEEAMKNFRDSYESARSRAGSMSMQAPSTMQSGGNVSAQMNSGNGSAAAEGNAQGGTAVHGEKSMKNNHS